MRNLHGKIMTFFRNFQSNSIKPAVAEVGAAGVEIDVAVVLIFWLLL